MTTLPPFPNEVNLEITIECTSDPSEKLGTPHRVVIHPDWTVQTLHDLDAERVARSFGGWSTCLAFVEDVVPAYRRALSLMTNDVDRFYETGRWEISPDCMFPGRSSDSSTGTAVTEVQRRLYTQLFARAGRSWAESGDPRLIDGGADGFLEMWEKGVLPLLIDELARSLPRSIWPLTPEFYSQAFFGGINLGWLAGVVNCFPDRDFAEWAVTQMALARMPGDLIGRMYELRLSSRDAINTLELRVPIEALTDLANRPGVGGPTAARWLTIWGRLGVAPSSSHYLLLESNGVLLERPPLWVLDSTARAMRKFGPDAPDRTELAVMLALTPDVELIKAAIRRGIRKATDPRFTQMIHRRKTK